ncbi:valyl-tRNA synthetase [Acetobacter nitrogenifigens DSM 23921 = NBRC 105050]|uniref:Valine--tRNA ligase n=1 Tax=Acetobacter nitrogenifigens DSM 23921 = NBRC 105050 TaxID=1120919 RepID=A0A511X7S5_9PROT|nr:valine--tRNA ligase [Acetobacter nitrogenifigens]GBQ95938.1 valyl-tRNA synthetase [Acetobacter nitrogenifigens DSM 23921 = NBRC 105050]GEN58999.1 valine--tRNA ligase [Acetobacter nitrogenifigens DSM 23921 = NBRC 105050]
MLDKTFQATDTEARLYAAWEQNGAFAADPQSPTSPFTVMIPPPNVTGVLHMGHALTMTVQDILIRWRRMQGRDALWQPGTDHAGIATQLVVERQLALEQQTRQALGRDAFIERVWKWKAESGDGITKQLRRLGASLDWSRERFTMDEGLSRAVREVFVTLHRQKLIYRDRRLVNWDPHFRTAISDLEVESKEVRGSLWYIRYPVDGAPDLSITVATTRPETMLGDVAVAVHPEDARYAALIGRSVILPLTGRRIPVVADEYSNPEKGTGAVKITPAHDFNDFEVGKRHNLPLIVVLDAGANITLEEVEADLRAEPGLADPEFVRGLQGLQRDDARRIIVEELERLGLLEKIEPHTHQVPHAERGGAVVEPRLTTQWYCDAATLAGPAIEAVESGRVTFVPRQWENTFFSWMRNIQPWCISRQLWWGHRIPAWYGPDGEVFVAHDEAGAATLAAAHYGESVALTQDEDVLDTWFSSGLWPFSTLGWPDKTPELARYYPTDVLVTGFDIIFFWVARMMMMGLHFMDDVPFHTVFIHGLVRDERGQKMSKSKGNGIDPLELLDTYGADAVRFTICALTGVGRDLKFGPKRVEDNRAFITKLWNAARFCEMNGVKAAPGFDPAKVVSPLGRWILHEASKAVQEATAALEAYRFDDYAGACYRFVWNRFCDWYLEFTKPAFTGEAGPEAEELRAVTAHVLDVVLRLLQPVMPFVTDTLWSEFGFGPSGGLIGAAWPEQIPVTDAAGAAAELDWVIRFISEIRTVRSEMNVPPSRLSPVLLQGATQESVDCATRWREAIGRMARVSEIEALQGEPPRGSAQTVLGDTTLVLPLADLIDLDVERARLAKELDKARGEIEKTERKLGNADFIARGKPEVVEETRERLVAQQGERDRLQVALGRLA